MPSIFRIGSREFSPGHTLVIAEIGTGHQGSADRARKLIDAAAEAGADCAKFQCVFASEIIHPLTGSVPLPAGSIALFDRFKALEQRETFYAELKAHTEARGLVFLCTPFGLESARLLKNIGVQAMKIASPELNHLPLIDQLASYSLPTIFSSGVSTLADIDRAIRRFRRGSQADAALLHCVTAYPAPAEDYNLRLLKPLSTLLGLPVGVSDHSLDPLLVPSLALASGASIIEKHICLSRDDPGLDDPIALPPEDFLCMTKKLRSLEVQSETSILAELKDSFGSAVVEAVLGDGVKRLAPSEEANYRRTNRSIHALRAIQKGEILEASSLALLRTEKILRPGLDPELLPWVIGRQAERFIPSGEGIEWEDVGGYGL